MPTRVLPCPCHQTLERVTYADHSLGRLVLACGRFDPPDAVRCPGTCVVALDRRDLLDHEATLELGNDTARLRVPAPRGGTDEDEVIDPPAPAAS